MARIFHVHWNKREAIETVRSLRNAGHVVRYHADAGGEAWKLLKESPPDVLIISLDRLPSHGRRIAAVTHEYKKLRDLPVIFVGGGKDQVDVTRKEFPDAVYCSFDSLLNTIKKVVA
jgi:DNA-binding NarL/FixJ family response regulator